MSAIADFFVSDAGLLRSLSDELTVQFGHAMLVFLFAELLSRVKSWTPDFIVLAATLPWLAKQAADYAIQPTPEVALDSVVDGLFHIAGGLVWRFGSLRLLAGVFMTYVWLLPDSSDGSFIPFVLR